MERLDDEPILSAENIFSTASVVVIHLRRYGFLRSSTARLILRSSNITLLRRCCSYHETFSTRCERVFQYRALTCRTLLAVRTWESVRSPSFEQDASLAPTNWSRSFLSACPAREARAAWAPRQPESHP